MEQQELDRARSRRWQLLGASLMLLVVLAGLVIALGGFGDGEPQGTESRNGVRGAKETAALLRGVPQRGVALGRPDAPAAVQIYADLHCPHCRSAMTGDELRRLIDDLVRPGKATLELRLHPLEQFGANSAAGRNAVYALADRGLAWNLALMLYFNQGAPGSGWIDADLLRRIAEVGPGLRGLALEPRETATGRRLAAEADALWKRLDLGGTPSYVVRARDGSAERKIGGSSIGGPVDEIEDAVDEVSSRGAAAR